MIKNQERLFYEENGYLIIKHLIENKVIEVYVEKIRSVANKQYAAIMNPDRIEFLIAQCYDLVDHNWSLSDKVNFVEMCDEISTMTLELMRNVKIVSILESLQNKEIVALMSQMLFKEAKSEYSSQAWAPHQDNSYPKNENGSYVTTNLFFGDSNIDNGTIYVFPKSHKYGLFQCKSSPSYREKKGSNPGNIIGNDILSSFDKINLEFEKGDLLILHGDLVHGSHPNYSDKSRPLLSCSYINKGEKFIPGNNAKRKVIELK